MLNLPLIGQRELKSDFKNKANLNERAKSRIDEFMAKRNFNKTDLNQNQFKNYLVDQLQTIQLGK